MEKITQCQLCSSTDVHPAEKYPYLSRCRNCGFIFANPRPTLEEIVAYYSNDAQYDHWISDLRGRALIWKWRFSVLLRFVRSGTLLDVGCGIGEFLNLAKKNFVVNGTEVSQSAIDYAESKYSLSIRTGAIESVDFGASRFDAVTAFHVLEHVMDPKSFVQKVSGLLNPGGIFIVAVPNEVDAIAGKFVFFLKKMMGKAGGAFRGIPQMDLARPNQEIHLSHFTEKTLFRLLESNGFTVAFATLDRYYGSTGFSRLRRDLLYALFLLIRAFTGKNYYEAMLVVARKKIAV